MLAFYKLTQTSASAKCRVKYLQCLTRVLLSDIVWNCGIICRRSVLGNDVVKAKI